MTDKIEYQIPEDLQRWYAVTCEEPIATYNPIKELIERVSRLTAERDELIANRSKQEKP